MELVILAAGMGSRFGGCKQMTPVDDYGNFIIDYSIYDAIEVGFDHVTFIIKEEMYDDFRETIGKRIEKKIKVDYAFQKLDALPKGYSCPSDRKKPWGTAQAILSAKNFVEDNFIIINADDYYGKDAFKVAANYLKALPNNAKGKYANVAFKVANTMTENGSVKRGICLMDGNKFKGMCESSIEKNEKGVIVATPLDEKLQPFEIEKDCLVSMNLFVFTKDIMQHLEDKFPAFLDENINDLSKCEYLIPTVVSDLINEKQATLDILSTTSVWHGITYRADMEELVSSLKKLVDSGLYKNGLWN